MNRYVAYIIVGGILIVDGLVSLITGIDGTYWGMLVPAETGWVNLLVGVLVCILAIRALLRGEGKSKYSKTYSNEEVAQAKAKLDAMYLRDYGVPPDKIPEDTKDPKES